jgi:hypothetical protein
VHGRSRSVRAWISRPEDGRGSEFWEGAGREPATGEGRSTVVLRKPVDRAVASSLVRFMTTDADEIDLLRVAYHEAAHAVVGDHFGWDTARVEIHDDGSGFYTPGDTGAYPTSAEIHDDIVITLAGRLGEVIMVEERAVTDEYLRDVIQRVRAGDPNDHDDFVVIRDLLAADPHCADELLIEEYRDAEEETAELLLQPEVRAKIVALVEALVLRWDGQIGEEAMTLMDETEDPARPSTRAMRRREVVQAETAAFLIGLDDESSTDDRRLAMDEDAQM